MINGHFPMTRNASGKRPLLLRGASLAAVVCGLAAGPLQAQSVVRPPNLRQVLGTAAATPAAVATGVVRPPNMREAIERANASRNRAEEMRGYVTSARDAALAATRAKPTDGLSEQGLDPVVAIREAVALSQAGDAAGAAAKLAGSSAANDATGKATWQGAALPVQTTENGKVVVTITQNEQRALLSWNRFDVGANTSLVFDQKATGVAQPGWTVVNRVVDSVAPSTILGSIKADGTVLVLNRNGVIFGENSQVNLHSLLASTLELGNFGRDFRDRDFADGRANSFEALSLAERNSVYLQNGLFTTPSADPLTQPPLLLSPEYEPGLNLTSARAPGLEGDVVVDAGASITADKGGFIILAAPKVDSAGTLKASDGQVSLQGGRYIGYALSTGAANGVDPDVRGVVLRSVGRGSATMPLESTLDDGIVINSGLIESLRGYVSLGAGLFGEVTNAGLLSATTSVSRNGKISLTAGKVTLAGSSVAAQAGGIVILPDASAETIPQGTADEPPSFKTSKVEIGARADSLVNAADPLGVLIPSVVTLGQNSLILAPSADVVIGRDASTEFNPAENIQTASRIDILEGAIIDVSGIKDVQLEASRNSLEISPVKRNELRDTPNYRESSLDGDFTLNGTTLFVDPRLSGVREDGVAWIGSPLIEAGSLASQIGVTASELMTKGGNVSLGVNLVTAAADAATAPLINIAKNATINFSGGWVNYAAGVVRTSKLITEDGRIVGIGQADTNDIFVGVADGFTESQPRFGLSQTFSNAALQGGHFEEGYDEGRDAGSLVIGGSALRIDGTLYGNAFAGARQIATGAEPSFASSIAGNTRLLQRKGTELPSGGFLRIGSFTGKSAAGLGADIIVRQADVPFDPARILLADSMLSGAGLSALTLQTSGSVTFADGGNLTLAPGGVLTVDAGRSIRFDGDVTAASGTIAARTHELGAVINPGSLAGIGSPFRTDDDILGIYALDTALPKLFDLTVNGTLSTAGRWVNDFGTTDPVTGRAWIDGGSISLTVAPKVLVALGPSIDSAKVAGDLSGSIFLNEGALLNVASGGYVAPNRTLDLTGRGGNVSLINETTYASLMRTDADTAAGLPGGSALSPILGGNQSVDFTPAPQDDEDPKTPPIIRDAVPALAPTEMIAEVRIADGSIKGFGFAGGGTFKLVAPHISFGSDPSPTGTHIDLDFLQQTGFGTLDLTTFRSRIVSDLFSNARAGNSAFFETSRFVIGAGETLDLTQSVLPSMLDQAQVGSLLSLASEADVTSVLAPVIPANLWDRKAANLVLGGLIELDVQEGGRVVGAPEASLTIPKLRNAGSIILNGGSILQRETLPSDLAHFGLGARDAEFGGSGLAAIFGPADANGRFDELALNAAGITGSSPVVPGQADHLLTNRELVSLHGADRLIYFLGSLDSDQGILLEAGSVTDVSGLALFDPRAPFLAGGSQLMTGRIVKGGTIGTSAAFNTGVSDKSRTLFTNPVYGSPRYDDPRETERPPLVGAIAGRRFDAFPGATIDISGASAAFDIPVTSSSYARTDQWSNGGTLSILAGGSLGGSLINASGGADKAIGGTLAWLRPTVRQSDAGAPADGVIFADQIEAGGFDILTALGGITFDGAVSLDLGKAFSVVSAPSTTGELIKDEAAVSISATQGTVASVAAPYIRLASRLGSIPDVGSGDGDASVSFNAGRSGIDLVGGILIGPSIAGVDFNTIGDVRLSGVDDRGAKSTELPALNGRLVAHGDISFDAARVYATTGTGNLQRIIEDRRAGRADSASAYLLAATGDSTIRFGGSHMDVTTPFSAGSYVKILAASIEQDGYLAAPLGLLEMGSNEATVGGLTVPQTQSLTFGAGSVTTVSAAGVNIPYGTTTDLTEYYFSPSVGLPLSAPPVGELRLNGGTIDVAEGALIDGRGGGDIFGYEFVSGTGGSRDVLDRFNRDRFSSNDYDPATGIGYQYPDHRQVYAIVPASQARAIAEYDPLYAADYGDLYGTSAGLSVTLDGASGLPAGEYLLLPARYALLPGALRIVENVGGGAPLPGASQTLLDGSIIMGGTFSTAGTGFADSARRSFTVQSQDSFLKYSRIETTSGSEVLAKLATDKGLMAPRLPLDAARVVLSPLNALRVAGLFDTTAAAGGKGAQIDIAGTNIVIAGAGAPETPGAITITDSTLANLHANSLVIGAERTDNVDGTTTLGVVATSVTVKGDASLTAPELVLAAGGRELANGGASPSIVIEDGAVLRATGTVDDLRTGDYIIPSTDTPPNGYRFDPTGVGAVLRLANGPERLVQREGDFALRNTLKPAELRIGEATIAGGSLSLDSSRNFNIATGALLDAPLIALSGDLIRFGGPFIKPELEAKLAAADRLTLRSPDVIGFAAGDHSFNNLVIDSPGLGLVAVGANADRTSNVTVNAGHLTLLNSSTDRGGCVGVAIRACGHTENGLTLNANEIVFGSGQFRVYGFDASVALAAANGMYVEGKGGLDVGSAGLGLTTPFLIDRAVAADPREQAVRPDYQIATSSSFVMTAPVLAVSPQPTGNRAPGSRIAIGAIGAPVADATIDGSLISATAGIVDIRAEGDIQMLGAARLATPGFVKTFGDATDSVTVSAGGGTIRLASLTGDIGLAATTVLSVDNGIGNAGSLSLIASNGGIDLGSALNPGVTNSRAASFTFDAGTSALDFASFVSRYGAAFQGDIAIRSGVGDLALDAGQAIRATSLSLTADGGAVTIAGGINSSGENVSGLSAAAAADARVNGGNIALYGMQGVSLASTAVLDTHTTGYADTDTRPASAGDVVIGIGSESAAISIASGALIDVGARRTEAALAVGETGNRLVPQIVKDPATLTDVTVYRFAEADKGGTVSFRAPVIGAAGDQIDIRQGGAISGAGSIQVEGYHRYDLNALAQSNLYSGLYYGGDTVYISLADNEELSGLKNILTEDFVTDDGERSVVNFIRNFNIHAADSSSLDGMRLRPGVELVSAGDFGFVTNWNLAAGVLDQDAAFAAGLLRPVDQLGSHESDGTPYYAVVAGREGELLANHVNFLYRVGGKASGEAGVLTLRAGHNLAIEHSISDGFFTFRDKSDAAYINYQLGGGDRTYNPAVQISCGGSVGDCGAVVNLSDVPKGVTPPATDIVSISLQTAMPGDESSPQKVHSPYTALGNGPAALGNGIGPDTGELAGDPLGFAELFPLLPDGSAIRSTDFRLVAGAGSTLSANPLRIDLASGGTVAVLGESSYRVEGFKGFTSYAGDLQFRFRLPGGVTRSTPLAFDIGEIFSNTTDVEEAGLDRLSEDAYTVLTWGAGLTGSALAARQQASAFFAGKGRTFTGQPSRTTGIIAPLGEVVAFMEQFAPTYANGVLKFLPGYNQTTPAGVAPISFSHKRAYAGTFVRTGAGSIDIAAAGDVDLLKSANPIYRLESGASTTKGNGLQANGQVGGSAVYTAGQRVSSASIEARIVGGGLISIAPDSTLLNPQEEELDFIPSPKALSNNAPVLATNGGSVTITADRDILGRRDIWSEMFLSSGAPYNADQHRSTFDVSKIGASDQVWRAGTVGQDTEIAIVPQYFTSGVGALAGGDVTVHSGRNVSDLTIALDTSVTTAPAASSKALLTFGSGDLSVSAAGNLLAGQFDVAIGAASISVDGSVLGAGTEPVSLENKAPDHTQYLRLRVSDARIELNATGTVHIAGVSALGASLSGNPTTKYNSAGFLSPVSGLNVVANETISISGNRLSQQMDLFVGETATVTGYVLPSSLGLASLTGDIVLRNSVPHLLYPSSLGQLSLLAGGDITSLTLAMSDSDPSLLPGAFSAFDGTPTSVLQGLGFGFPGVLPTTSDAILRLYHNQQTTHAGDVDPARIYADGSISRSAISLPKQARIGAGLDLVDFYFVGQNVSASDVTRISAGRDITATTGFSTSGNLPYIVSNNFALGGPGSFYLQAGRNLGPFINSATVNGVSFAGGIRTVGNDFNPWLPNQGANIFALYGVAKGVAYDALRDTYLNPSNGAELDGDLFEQIEDPNGNKSPDRTRPVYAPILAEWLRDNEPAAFSAVLGDQSFADDVALASAAYGRYADLYTAFTGLGQLRQQQFLINQLYFNELAQPSQPDSTSYLQYIRGYRAVQTLFPVERGYTDNLAVYTIDPSTVNVDHPLGVPTRNIVDGQPQRADRILTGEVDLRLATIETTRGGDVTILGPGGDFIAGSVVRTSEQASRRLTRFTAASEGILQSLNFGKVGSSETQKINSIPIGYEGILTLRGGSIRSFTDGDFRLNQSRLFTQAGGDITMWSSNGDLNAGQGPKSASNFPPITIRFDPNGLNEVDSAGSVSGAGIGAFQQSPDQPLADVILIAPVGEVDAGDAGVRASGNVFVAAARVANADNFSAGGDVSGVPAAGVTAAPAVPTDAASSIVAQVARLSDANKGDGQSLISVDVLGYVGGDDPCADPSSSDPSCIKK